jgi:hypothetical protein
MVFILGAAIGAAVGFVLGIIFSGDVHREIAGLHAKADDILAAVKK